MKNFVLDLILATLCCSQLCISQHTFINEFAVHIKGGHHTANRVAREAGLVNRGQVNSIFFCLPFYEGMFQICCVEVCCFDVKCLKEIHSDLPLILIWSVYDFLTLKFGKIQIFPPKIGRNTDFFMECQTFFLILSLFIQIFCLQYWFFWSFILILCEMIVAGLYTLTTLKYSISLPKVH